MEQLRGAIDFDRLIGSFADRVRATRIPRGALFKADVIVITLDSVLSSPAPASYRFVEEDAKTSLEFKGIRYQVSAPVAPGIRAMLARPTFRGAELAEYLDADSRLVLIRHLVDIGFLSLVR